MHQLWGDTPTSKKKEEDPANGRRGKITFIIKLHTFKKFSEGSNKPCVHQDPGKRSSEPTETDKDLPEIVQESLVEAWVRDGLLQG